jgi:hypothetical protein
MFSFLRYSTASNRENGEKGFATLLLIERIPTLESRTKTADTWQSVGALCDATPYINARTSSTVRTSLIVRSVSSVPFTLLETQSILT